MRVAAITVSLDAYYDDKSGFFVGSFSGFAGI
jgi:hypothetical protein